MIDECTFSAAEELAYDLQQLDRAKLIGAKTKGGNHFTRNEPLIDKDSSIGCDTRFQILIPSCYSINPVSRTNWEDGPIVKDENFKPGVVPNIPIRESQNALSVALTFIKKSVNSSSPAAIGLFSSSLSNQALATDDEMAKSAFHQDSKQNKS